MTLQSSGLISIDDIADEYGGVAPDALSEYYAGGTRVPGGTEGINGPIPSSGIIDVSDFYGSPLAETPETTINFQITTGQGPDNTTIHASTSIVLGYNRVWAVGDPNAPLDYGNVTSGSAHSNQGWGIASLLLIQEESLISSRALTFLINQNNANFGTNIRFRYTLSGYTDGPHILDTNSASSDGFVQITDSLNQTRNVRQHAWSLGSQADPVWLQWQSGSVITCKAERL